MVHVKRGKLRLPLTSPNLALDRASLRPRDVIRSVDIKLFPDIEVYQPLIDALKAEGYSEAQWNDPKAENVFYVFPYDWRHNDASPHTSLSAEWRPVQESRSQAAAKI